MKKNNSWFIAERAIHLAILHQTRRSDLIVTRPDENYGIDILVEQVNLWYESRYIPEYQSEMFA